MIREYNMDGYDMDSYNLWLNEKNLHWKDCILLAEKPVFPHCKKTTTDEMIAPWNTQFPTNLESILIRQQQKQKSMFFPSEFATLSTTSFFR